MVERWTLEELVRRVGMALAAGNVRAPNGRVTEVPDARVIRWYATIGLVDRPTGMRGRTALYGPRHLMQLVAVKCRQAQGRTLAEIQHELAGATDATLQQVAREAFGSMDAGTPEPARPGTDGEAGVGTRRAGAGGEARAEVGGGSRGGAGGAGAGIRSGGSRGGADAGGGGAGGGGAEPARTRFWTRPAGVDLASADLGGAIRGGAGVARADQPSYDADTVVLHGIDLIGGDLGGTAVLLVPGAPTPDDLAAIQAEAGPLVGLLADRGLLAGPDHRAGGTRARHEPAIETTDSRLEGDPA